MVDSRQKTADVESVNNKLKICGPDTAPKIVAIKVTNATLEEKNVRYAIKFAVDMVVALTLALATQLVELDVMAVVAMALDMVVGVLVPDMVAVVAIALGMVVGVSALDMVAMGAMVLGMVAMGAMVLGMAAVVAIALGMVVARKVGASLKLYLATANYLAAAANLVKAPNSAEQMELTLVKQWAISTALAECRVACLATPAAHSMNWPQHLPFSLLAFPVLPATCRQFNQMFQTYQCKAHR